jgi:hypothetical protein
MRTLLKILSQTHDIRGFVLHWRLTLPMSLGAAVACVLWALLSNQKLGTVIWTVIVGLATTAGIIWDRRHHEQEPP